ncbi:MAG: ABC transporter substrate-binding protein, partial [Cyanobacteriota bacterium]|nr:ABC transporter substrate-binding protein [Cyanobacteriota bacterium]
MASYSRRRFLITAAGTALGSAVLAACGGKSSSPQASTGGGDTEVKTATLGFIALTDAAPLIIAKEKGFFAKHGMPDVKVVKQTSWA